MDCNRSISGANTMTFGDNQCQYCCRSWFNGPIEQYTFTGGTVFVCPYCRAPIKDGDPHGTHPEFDIIGGDYSDY